LLIFSKFLNLEKYSELFFIYKKGLLANINPGLLETITKYFISVIMLLLDIDIPITIIEMKIQKTISKTYLFKVLEFIPLEKEDLKAILVATT
jgi:hypothetical protein